MDGPDRLTEAKQGQWDDVAEEIGTTVSQQLWTLSHTGNWLEASFDRDGDSAFGGAGEYDHGLSDTDFTDANELTTWGSAEPEYDALGNMVDDDEHYEYVYDAFGRLREVKVPSSSLTVAKYVYNGLNHRISWSEKDPDSQSVPPDHIWFHVAYDAPGTWRQVAVYKEDDADPTERFVYHNAGLDGRGSASYIDSVILRDRDTSADGESAALDAEQRRGCSGRRSADAAGHQERGGQCETVPDLSDLSSTCLWHA